jgi:hypothetical protein
MTKLPEDCFGSNWDVDPSVKPGESWLRQTKR